MFKDIGKLIYHVYNEGETEITDIEAYLNKKSVKRQEFYTAIQSGVNPTCTFEMRTLDWELTRHIDNETNKPMYATQVEYEGAIYDIVRSYDMPNDITELICS